MSWEKDCLPKKEGGLGWKKGAIMKLIWNLFTEFGSLWVAWVQQCLLNGRRFWTTKVPQDCTWRMEAI